MAIMHFRYDGHEPLRVTAPTCDLHGRWLIPPKSVAEGTAGIWREYTPGQRLQMCDLHDKHEADFLRHHPQVTRMYDHHDHSSCPYCSGAEAWPGYKQPRSNPEAA